MKHCSKEIRMLTRSTKNQRLQENPSKPCDPGKLPCNHWFYPLCLRSQSLCRLMPLFSFVSKPLGVFTFEKAISINKPNTLWTLHKQTCHPCTKPLTCLVSSIFSTFVDQYQIVASLVLHTAIPKEISLSQLHAIVSLPSSCIL